MLADESDGGCLLIDYKSDRVGAQEDLGALVERDYGVQRLLYALAVLRDGAPKVEIVHWFLERPQDWVGARYAAADQSELEERLAARIQRAHAHVRRQRTPSSRPLRDLSRTGGAVLLGRRRDAARDARLLSERIEALSARSLARV